MTKVHECSCRMSIRSTANFGEHWSLFVELVHVCYTLVRECNFQCVGYYCPPPIETSHNSNSFVDFTLVYLKVKDVLFFHTWNEKSLIFYPHFLADTVLGQFMSVCSFHRPERLFSRLFCTMRQSFKAAFTNMWGQWETIRTSGDVLSCPVSGAFAYRASKLFCPSGRLASMKPLAPTWWRIYVYSSPLVAFF